MRNVITIVWTAVVLTMLSCSRVTVPPDSLGKILSSSGYSVDVKEAGNYWIPAWDDMILLDVTTQTFDERMTVRMADNLEMTFNLRFRSRIMGDDKVINTLFNDIQHEDYKISLRQVYNVYGRDVVTSATRSVLSKYESDEVSVNFDNITQELNKRIAEELANSPLAVSNVTMAEVEYPPVTCSQIEDIVHRRIEELNLNLLFAE